MFHVKHGRVKHRTPSSGFSRDESLESVQVAGRTPQSPELSFETRCPARVSIKLSFKALASASKILCAPSALMKNA